MSKYISQYTEQTATQSTDMYLFQRGLTYYHITNANLVTSLTSSLNLAQYLTTANAATTYVPLTRTLTINGTTYDLSANRSWTIPTGGNETLAQTLALGNTSGAYDILMNTTQRIGFKDGDNTNTSYISNNQTAPSATMYLPHYDGRAVIHATGTSLTSGRVPYVTTNGLVADSANFVWDNSNYRLGVGNGVSSSATIHSKGSTADSTAYALKVDNSSSSALLYVRNDGLVTIGDTTPIYANLFSVKKNVAGLAISDFINTNTSDGGDAVVVIGQSASKASLFIYHNSASTLSPYLSSLTMADTLKISASKTGTLDTGNIATVARNIYNITSFIGVNGANTMLDQTGFKISSINSGLNSANSNLFAVNDGFSSFGFATTATAYVDIIAGTTSAASLRIRAGVAPSSPNDGDIYYINTNDRLMFYKNATACEILSASAVTTEAVTSDTTLTITYNGTTYKLLAKA